MVSEVYLPPPLVLRSTRTSGGKTPRMALIFSGELGEMNLNMYSEGQLWWASNLALNPANPSSCMTQSYLLTNRKGHPVWAPLSFSYPQWAGFGQMRIGLLGTIRSVDLEEVEQVVDVDGTITVQVTRTRRRVFTASIVRVGQRIVVLCLWVGAAFERKDTA